MSSEQSEPPPADHYFTAEPASQSLLRRRDVTLAGRDVTVWTAGGIFSPEHIDRGTAVLIKHLPEPPTSGTFLDLGCGWGPLALTLAMKSPEADVYAVDVNLRALDLMQRNADTFKCGRITAAEPGEVPDDATFDLIWSNPAIRIGKDALHAMLMLWLPRLAPGGSAYFVVSKNLGADSLQGWLSDQNPDWTVDRIASDKGFRVLRIRA